MLRAEAGVGGRDEVLHPQAVDPFAGELRFAEREPNGQKASEGGGARCFVSKLQDFFKSKYLMGFLKQQRGGK